jgi:hypothetical protein
MAYALLTGWTILVSVITCIVGIWAAVVPQGSVVVGLMLVLLGLATAGVVIVHARQEALRRDAARGGGIAVTMRQARGHAPRAAAVRRQRTQAGRSAKRPSQK